MTWTLRAAVHVHSEWSYDAKTLATLDFVIASVHSRFGMSNSPSEAHWSTATSSSRLSTI